MRTLLTVALVAALAGPAGAQHDAEHGAGHQEEKGKAVAAAPGGRVDERRPATADARVDIEAPSGMLRVVAWDRNEVQVTGTVSRESQGLEFDGSESRIRIRVEAIGHPDRSRSELEIRVPRRASLRVESFAGSIQTTDVQGEIRAETVQGSITISGAAGDVNAETVNGSVEVSGTPRYVKAESVNGGVTVRGASGEVAAASVSGGIAVSGGRFRRVKLECVSGPVRFDGELEKGADLDIEAVSGKVELTLPAATGADLSISTFSGDIKTDFEAVVPPRRSGEWGSERELSATIGGGGARISIETMSGSVWLKKK